VSALLKSGVYLLFQLKLSTDGTICTSAEKDSNTTLDLIPYHDKSDENNDFFVSYGRPIYIARNMTGMPYSLLRLGFPDNGEEYYEIEYENSSNIFGVGDIPPHRHIEPTSFEEDDFFEQNFKADKYKFEELMENYTFYLHFTGNRWYGKL
jgi:hypothetical protein